MRARPVDHPARGDQVVDGAGNAVRRLVEDDRARLAGELGEPFGATRPAAGEEPLEHPTSGGQPADAERHHHRRGSGDGGDVESGIDRSAYQSLAGVADAGRTGVAADRDDRSLGEEADHIRHPVELGVLVHDDEPLGTDAMAVQQPAGAAGVLARDDVGVAKGGEGSLGEVAEIADRCRDEDESPCHTAPGRHGGTTVMIARPS